MEHVYDAITYPLEKRMKANVLQFLQEKMPKHFPVGTRRKVSCPLVWPYFVWDDFQLNSRTYHVDYSKAGVLVIERLS